jgi:hypothetical protein
MEPVIRANTKTRVNLACPECGLDLRKAPNGGFANYGDTYCCRGCATGTGCTCYAGTETKKSFNRPGAIGQRNAENTPRDGNFNAEENTSSERIGRRKHATARQYKSRDQRQWDPRSKRLRTQNKPRVSSREQARGRSEERGRMSKRVGSRGGDRISRTGSKGN